MQEVFTMQETIAITTIVDRYLASWNETDAGRRRALIAAAWAEDGTYRDPLNSATGRDGIDTMIGEFQGRYPDQTFRLRGEVTADGQTARFGWSLHGPDGTTQLTGHDDATLDTAGRLQSITGTFDSPVPQ
jgi:hypothetical protein